MTGLGVTKISQDCGSAVLGHNRGTAYLKREQLPGDNNLSHACWYSNISSHA